MIIPFGKRHKGKEMAQVFKEDPEYIEWIANYDNQGQTFKINDKMREEAKQFLGMTPVESGLSRETKVGLPKEMVLEAIDQLRQVISEM